MKAGEPVRHDMRGKSQQELVLFRFRHTTAKAVVLIGITGDWHPSFVAMEKCGDGFWQKYLHMWPGEYSYGLVIDGVPDFQTRRITVPPPSRPDSSGSPLVLRACL